MGNQKLNNLKLKLLIKELNLLESEEEYIKEFTSFYKPLFNMEIHKSDQELPIITGETQNVSNKNEKKYEVTDEELLKIKNVFRTIAKFCHPDKTSDIYLISMYSEAQMAYDRNDLLTLYKISQKLSIDIELDESNIFLLEKIVNEKKQTLKLIENSFLWLWVHAKTDDQKKHIIDEFLKIYNKT